MMSNGVLINVYNIDHFIDRQPRCMIDLGNDLNVVVAKIVQRRFISKELGQHAAIVWPANYGNFQSFSQLFKTRFAIAGNDHMSGIGRHV